MGEEAEVLEHHAHLVPAQVDELARVHRHDVVAVDEEVSGGGFHEARYAAHQRRLATPGKSHHHEGLALLHLEGDILHRDDVAGLLLHVLARE